jgi:hypothetical protein
VQETIKMRVESTVIVCGLNNFAITWGLSRFRGPLSKFSLNLSRQYQDGKAKAAWQGESSGQKSPLQERLAWGDPIPPLTLY